MTHRSIDSCESVFLHRKKKKLRKYLFQLLNLRLLVLRVFPETLKEKWICLGNVHRATRCLWTIKQCIQKNWPFVKFCHKVKHLNPLCLVWRILRVSLVKKIPNMLCVHYYLLKNHKKRFSFLLQQLICSCKKFARSRRGCNKPLQLFIEKRQFFNQNNQWLNNIILSLNSRFTVFLNVMICFSERFCDNSQLVLKMRFQVFSCARKRY